MIWLFFLKSSCGCPLPFGQVQTAVSPILPCPLQLPHAFYWTLDSSLKVPCLSFSLYIRWNIHDAYYLSDINYYYHPSDLWKPSLTHIRDLVCAKCSYNIVKHLLDFIVDESLVVHDSMTLLTNLFLVLSIIPGHSGLSVDVYWMNNNETWLWSY